MYRRLTDEAIGAESSFVWVDAAQVQPWTELARTTPRRRYRLCAHETATDALHEMIICLDRTTYVRPHLHRGKSESLHVVDGLATLLLFDAQGSVQRSVQLGPYSSGRTFFYRISEPVFHTLVIESAQFLFHEVTLGPLDPSRTEYAAWAPAETGDVQAGCYRSQLYQWAGVEE